jgi:acyl-CoA thioester hydrolase
MAHPASGKTALMDAFPYEVPELDLNVPFDHHRAVVRPEWIDWNGHMNLAYYVTVFDQASGTFTRRLGLGAPYREAGWGQTFVLETHITYDREAHEGDPLRVTTLLVDRDAKRMHMYMEMFHAEKGYLISTSERVGIHIDQRTRKSSPYHPLVRQRIDQVFEVHRQAPRPANVGRVMGIRRKTG